MMKADIVLLVILLDQLQLQVLCHSSQRDKWFQSSNQLDDIIWPLKNKFITLLDTISRDYFINYSDDCRKSLSDFRRGLQAGSRESYVMFDSFSKFHPGFIGERAFDYGAYEQCLNAKFNTTIGRYVVLQMDMPLPEDPKEIRYDDEADSWISEFSNKMSSIRLHSLPIAFCLPNTCSEYDVQQIIESDTIQSIAYPISLQVKTTESMTDNYVSDHRWLQILARIVLTSIIAIVIVSTVINYYAPHSNILTSFDACCNTAKLFTEGKEENKNLSFFNGLRTIYLILNIPSHVGIPHNESTFQYNFAVLRSLGSCSEIVKSFTLTAPHFVSSNILMAACLSAIGWLPEMRKSSRGIGFLGFVMLRALRTLPVMIAMMLITFSFPLIRGGGGPLMNHMQRSLSNKCYEHGWKELLFISNWGSFHEMCMPVAWFMSADFQLYVFSFLYLALMNTKPRLAFAMIAAQIVAGIIIHGFYLSSVNVGSILILWSWDGYSNLHGYIQLFAHTFNYISIYPIGVILGYLMVNGFRIRFKNVGAVFSGVFVLGNLVAFSPLFLYDGIDFKAGRTAEIIFGSLHRVMFVSLYATACLLIYSHPNFIVARLLSSKPLTVISRFSFSTFMAHPLVIMFTLSSLPDLYVSDSFMTMMYTNIVIRSLVAGYFLFIFIEAPAMNLLKSLAAKKLSKRNSVECRNNNNYSNHED